MPDDGSLHTFIIALFFCIVAAAVVSDVRSLLIRNSFSMALFTLYPAYVLTAPVTVDWLGAIGVAIAVFAAGLVLFTLRLLGGGDVKLLAVLALWAGPGELVHFLLATTLAGGALAVLMLSPSRFALASLCERAGAEGLSGRLLGSSIPYALAIATGTFATIAPMLLVPSP